MSSREMGGREERWKAPDLTQGVLAQNWDETELNRSVTCRGHAALETFSSVLNMPTMNRKTFAKCMHNLSVKNKEVKKKNARNVTSSC
ncbi:hypothetical protein TNCV_4199511 [Trichonephila clavipes]|uniref:Uncharacterized protein n=1 Tax=Trichonephila clavipes TaxID=2585209 RepID=A0A8X6WB66_TRICX|nr:hypothetical protein TNCV_4199511 [Trichonephila clavipes]